ncbi:hypothetical protein [Desulfogranum marinum]|uniref:hypothetical protein n=1 Tax=Desulfogranum marinum TaxID=453220 RepID=UPI0029C7F5F3|nr:hypothetical protein [Desulfogranum marinum]
MTIKKHPLVPHMVRQVPDQFSWVDHRLVRERYIDHISHSAACLYLFLVTVSDAQGVSYYSDQTLQQRLGMDGSGLASARNALMEQQLIAFRKPLYQVLALDYRRGGYHDQL